MKAIRNIDKHNLEVPFDFRTYLLPMNKTVMVNDDLYEFLKERFPNSFSFDVEVKKVAPMVASSKSKAIIQPVTEPTFTGEDMMTSKGENRATFGNVDETPPSGTVDSDGVTWYGEGVQVEGGNI